MSSPTSSVSAGQAGLYLSADGTVMTIVLGTTSGQDKNVKVDINGLEDANGNQITNYSITKTLIDHDVPSVSKVEVKNAKTLEVYFNEPVDLSKASAGTLDKVQIDGADAIVSSVVADYVNKKATLNLVTALGAGSHTVAVQNVADFAGLVAPTYSTTINVATDSTAPQITSVQVVDRKILVVTFNENLNTAIAGTYTVEFGGTTSTTTATNVTGYANKKKLTLNTPLNLSAVVEAKVKYNGQKDVVGNAVAPGTEFMFTANDDKVVPTVSAVLHETALASPVLAKNSVTFTFSKPMQALGTLKVTDNNGNTVTTYDLSNATFRSNTDNKILDLSAATLGLSIVNAGEYTISLTGMKDNSIRQNALADKNIAVSAIDTKAPTAFGSFVLDGTEVTIKFDEAMDSATLKDLSHYMYDTDGYGNATGTVKILSTTSASLVEVSNDKKSVTLNVPNVNSNYEFKLYGLTDTAGNIVSNADTALVVADPANAQDLTISSAKATSKTTIEVVMDTPISAIDPSSFEVTNSGGTKLFDIAAAVVDASAPTKVTLTVNGELDADAYKYKLAKSSTAANCLLTTNIYGASISGAAVSMTDKIAPTLQWVRQQDADTNYDTIQLKYDENVYIETTNPSLLEYDLQVYDLTADEQLDLTDFSVSASGDTVNISIDKNEIVNHKFAITLDNGRYISDDAAGGSNFSAAENHPAAFTQTTVKDSDGINDANISEGAVPAGFTGDEANLGFSNATGKVVATGAVAPTAAEEGILQIAFGADTSHLGTIYSSASDLDLTWANTDTIITDIPTQAAGAKVWYRMVDTAGNATEWQQDGVVTAALGAPSTTLANGVATDNWTFTNATSPNKDTLAADSVANIVVAGTANSYTTEACTTLLDADGQAIATSVFTGLELGANTDAEDVTVYITQTNSTDGNESAPVTITFTNVD